MAKAKNQNVNEEAVEQELQEVEEAEIVEEQEAEEPKKTKKKFFEGVTLKGVGLGILGTLGAVAALTAAIGGKKTDDEFEACDSTDNVDETTEN